MLRNILISSAVLTLFCSVGCRTQQGRLLPAPGPIWYQQQQAVLHDPYGATDIGPEIAGGRPRAYDHPQPEATRSKYFRESWWGQQ